MFAQKGEYESEARLDCGPPAPGAGHVPSLDLLLVNGIAHHSMDACAENAASVLSNNDDAEPDSSVGYVLDDVIISRQKIFSGTKLEFLPSKYRVAENEVSPEEEGADESSQNEERFFSDESGALLEDHTLVAEEAPLVSDSPLSPQNVTELSQELTVDSLSGVGNLVAVGSTVRNMPVGNRALCLSEAPRGLYEAREEETEAASAPVSRIILSGTGRHFTAHSGNDRILTASKAATDHEYSPKVQILSSVTIPKRNSISGLAQINSVGIKGVLQANYLTRNDLARISSPANSPAPKRVVTNSILNSQVGGKSTLAGSGGRGATARPLLGSHTRSPPGSVSKLDNVTNTKMVSGTVAMSSRQTHVLSRVVPGPAVSLKPATRGLKTTNVIHPDQKLPGKAGLFPTIVHGQKVACAVPVKIIQQQNTPSGLKSGTDAISLTTQSLNSSELVSYSSVNSSTPNKVRSNVQSQGFSQKRGSYTKSISGAVSLQKVSSRSVPQKLVLQSSPSRGQIVVSGSPQSPQRHRMTSQYYHASGDGDNTVRYIQNYIGVESGEIPDYTANQNLTAQILQSLSQPKILYPATSHTSLAHSPLTTVYSKRSQQLKEEEAYQYYKHTEQRVRQIHGDPTTLLLADDIVGIEERPPLSDESLPYQYRILQFVMLDHTYAVTTQAIASSGNATNPVIGDSPSSVAPQAVVAISPVTPSKTSSFNVQHGISTQANGPLTGQSPVTSNASMNFNSGGTSNVIGYQYKISPVEDDAASIISSLEGERTHRADERHDSDTETAPEGEEEGKTRCVCDFTHDDGYMICCDRCGEWQHVDCMGIDRQQIPDDYMCDRCHPRLMDRKRARSIQMRKREELTGPATSGSDSSVAGSALRDRDRRLALGTPAAARRKRPLTVTTYSTTVGGVSRVVPTVAVRRPELGAVSTLPVPTVKRGPDRPRRADGGRKGPKRKIPDKKMKRKSGDPAGFRRKFCALPASSRRPNRWNDSYESAMTNHYSPELRAKVARYCSTKAGGNASAMAAALTAHHCTTVPHAGGKILIATRDLRENTPVMELRGKYLLAAQHRPPPRPGRAGAQRPGPFLFFYRLPRDSAQVCIDTRTYGNEARFVRRSCKPNAELQHCIIKGALHVYLVTTSAVQSNTEISIQHEAAGGWHPCACGNPKHCEQNGVSSSTLHRNNGATGDVSVRERRGRARHSSSSSPFSPLPLTSPAAITEDISPKRLLSPKAEKRRRSEPELVPRTVEIAPPESLLTMKTEAFNALSIVVSSPERKPCVSEIIPVKEEIDVPVNEVLDIAKEDVEMKVAVKVECPVTPEPVPLLQVKDEKLEISEKITESEPPKLNELKCSTQSGEQVSDSDSPKKDMEKYIRNSNVLSRRSSVHSTRTTRASISAAFTASESADEKSDPQGDGNTKVLSAKDKKKMTREERKMEAIMKAFERMEKAEQRKQENRDRQTKRRESDPQPSSDFKEQTCISDDHFLQNGTKRRRRKGRSRTTSQSNQSSRNRLNSVDSDMVTSGEESTSLLSPPICSGADPPEDCPYRDLTLAETELVLGRSVERISVGLSSACLLVEAAVGPLETTFKFPKTKKAIMNEWLGKSPEPVSYEVAHPLDFAHPADNNNSAHPYLDKQSFLGEKSTDSLVRAADTMIGNLSGGIVGAGFTPEKRFAADQIGLYDSPGMRDSPPSPVDASPVIYSQRSAKKLSRETCREAGAFSNDKSRTPKKFRKGLRSCPEERPSPLKRSLRSSYSSRLEGDFLDSGARVSSEDHKICDAAGDVAGEGVLLAREAHVSSVSAPPQHSAKKRWLRQAISEESDSPTAESPPNEMVTPLKKRRLARESLSLEPTAFGQCEDAQYGTLSGTPRKEATTSQLYAALSFPSLDERKHEVIYSMEGSVDCNDVLNRVTENSHPMEIFQSPEIAFDTIDSSRKNEETRTLDTMPPEQPAIVQETVCNEARKDMNSHLEISELMADFSSFKSVKKMGKHSSKSKDDMCSGELDHHKGANDETKSEPASNAHSRETSGNSSPQLDEMDDIQKKIHSFHTENIQILKIRNKKQPKEKRKKVNLNFDLCVLADQTIGVELKTEKDVTEEADNKSVQKSLELNSNPATPDSNSIADTEQTENTTESLTSALTVLSPGDNGGNSEPQPESISSNPDMLVNSEASASFNSISEDSQADPAKETTHSEVQNLGDSEALVPDISVIKNAIDTTCLEAGVFSDTGILNSVDEYRNVQEILTRVNQMDSRNSVLLSGVLRDSNHSVSPDTTTPTKVFVARSNDPRLNPPPVEKPKPIRRKLSITEYRRRYSMAAGAEGTEGNEGPVGSPGASPSLSPPSPLSASCSPPPPPPPDLAARLEAVISRDTFKTKSVFNAQPTLLEKQREKLNERLRREFGLLLPEDEETKSPTLPAGMVTPGVGGVTEGAERGSGPSTPPPAALDVPCLRLDR